MKKISRQGRKNTTVLWEGVRTGLVRFDACLAVFIILSILLGLVPSTGLDFAFYLLQKETAEAITNLGIYCFYRFR